MTSIPAGSISLSSGATEQSAHQLDVIGIGALNVDHVAVADPERFDIERGTESVADQATISGILTKLDQTTVSTALGGSAFNTIFALAQLDRGLSLGYVGAAGDIPAHGRSAVGALQQAGIDTDGVFPQPAMLSGICLAMMDRGERTLLTHAGANIRMAQVISQHFDQLLSYLTRAKTIHVTSLLDDASPKQVVRLLGALRSRTMPYISFDPGHVWCTARSDETLALMRMSDCLLLNASEFRALGRVEPAGDDHIAAGRVLALMDRPEAVALVKRPDGVTMFSKDGDAVARTVVPQMTLDASEIVDATGAGDVFAAGLLAARAIPGIPLEDGVQLGLRLARHRLRHRGTTGHHDFAELARRMLDGELDTGEPSGDSEEHNEGDVTRRGGRI